MKRCIGNVGTAESWGNMRSDAYPNDLLMRFDYIWNIRMYQMSQSLILDLWEKLMERKAEIYFQNMGGMII